mmetsp:Transcript_35020/g.104769  ORF Transcript_35020/g.104769 Transcript_35020/m.104769 type:complete len:211 (+) Transcript_35020:57-689(+)
MAQPGEEAKQPSGGDDPLASFFHSRPKDSDPRPDEPRPSRREAPDGDADPMAHFFGDRPSVKNFEDPKEAFRRRVERNNAPIPGVAFDGPPSRARRAVSRGGSSSRSRSGRRADGHKLSEFIKDNDLDEKCCRVLRSMSAESAQQIMAQGFDVRGCRNPSAVVMSRIQKLEREGRPAGPPPGHGDSRGRRRSSPSSSRSRSRRRRRRRRH